MRGGEGERYEGRAEGRDEERGRDSVVSTTTRHYHCNPQECMPFGGEFVVRAMFLVTSC